MSKLLILIKRKHLLKEKEISAVKVCVTNTRITKCPVQQKYSSIPSTLSLKVTCIKKIFQ
jgi:hypothetical protein